MYLLTKCAARHSLWNMPAMYTGYVLGPCNVSVEGNVTYLPVYMTGMFHNE